MARPRVLTRTTMRWITTTPTIDGHARFRRAAAHPGVLRHMPLRRTSVQRGTRIATCLRQRRRRVLSRHAAAIDQPCNDGTRLCGKPVDPNAIFWAKSRSWLHDLDRSRTPGTSCRSRYARMNGLRVNRALDGPVAGLRSRTVQRRPPSVKSHRADRRYPFELGEPAGPAQSPVGPTVGPPHQAATAPHDGTTKP
jgi:hypothetical protein